MPVACAPRPWHSLTMIKSLLFAALLAMTASAATAEELPVQRVFAAPALNGPAPRGVQISPDGSLVTYLKPEPTDQTTFDLWARPIQGGAERRLIEGAAVEPKTAVLTEAEKGRRERQRIAGDHGVVDYKWDEIGAQILVPAAGKLYLADAKTGASEWTMAGTNSGHAFGFAATGRLISIRGASIFRFAGGRIAQQRDYWSLQMLNAQLGIKTSGD